MAILEKEAWVNLYSNNISYYDELGYNIPRYKASDGKYKVKKGTKILVKVEDIQKGSNTTLTKICDVCGNHILNQSCNNIYECRKNGNGRDYCKKCRNKKGGMTKKDSVTYEKSLEYYAKENNKEYLLDEFSEKNIKVPSEINYWSPDSYWWNCPDCNSEYDVGVNKRICNQNCPYCANRRVNETNCLWATHPEIAKLLKNAEVGYRLTAYSTKKEIFICEHCGCESHPKTVYKVSLNRFSCHACSDGISYPEKFVMSLLKQLNVTFECQKMFNWSKNIKCSNEKLNGSKVYDFYIPSLSCIIETHGLQHYSYSSFRKTLEQEKENDALKEALATNNNIKNYIVIDCRNSELEWIKNNIMDSVLPKLLCFKEEAINWLECHKYSCNSLVKEVCELWSNGTQNTRDIANTYNINPITVRRYLKQGNSLNWCNYDTKEEKQKASLKGSALRKRKVVQLTMNGEFIREWGSLVEASKSLNLKNTSSISNACRGKYNSAGGFKWMYKEEYMQ